MRILSIVVVCLTCVGAVPSRGERPGTQRAVPAGDVTPMLAGTICIATGLDSSVDGFLHICPDDYGAWATDGGGGTVARFNPTGPEPARSTTWTSGFLLFDAAGTQRELLSDSAYWHTFFGPDASLTRSVISPLLPSDVQPVDGMHDTLLSSFAVSGGSTALVFELRQHVKKIVPGLAEMEQTYRITNVSELPVEIVLVRSTDLDLVFNGTAFDDDSVGTTWNTVGGDRYVTLQEADDPRTAVTLTSSAATVYFGGRRGIDPDGGGVPYGYGTDDTIWLAYGVPDGTGGADGSDWRNNIAGVGYDTDGFSGATPVGCGEQCDGFIGLQIPLSLDADETVEIKIVHRFGTDPADGLCNSPCVWDIDGSGDVRVPDLIKLLSCWGPLTGDPLCACFDIDGSTDIRVPDLIALLAKWGVCP